MSTPVSRCKRAATVSGGIGGGGGGGGGTVSSARHRARLAVRPRVARTPKCRRRTKPAGEHVELEPPEEPLGRERHRHPGTPSSCPLPRHRVPLARIIRERRS